MPADIINRDQFEADIAEAMGETLAEYYDNLLATLGDPPKIDKVTPAWWIAFAAALTQALQPKIERVFREVVTQIEEVTTIGWEGATQSAAEWASRYTYDLVTEMTQSRQTLLQQSIADFYNNRMTLGDLQARLQPEFGVVRAEMIGVTETTRAAAEAQRLFADQLRAQGVDMVDVVNTVLDERVCPVCGPKHGKAAATEGYPPFHPRCRCGVESVPVAQAEEYMAGLQKQVV